MTKLEALRRSRLKWYAQWAVTVATNDSPPDDFDTEECSLCLTFDCDDCPLGGCCRPGDLFMAWIRSETLRQNIDTARALYEELECLYQKELRGTP